MRKKISATLIVAFILVILASGCSSMPNRSSEVGNPNPSEDTVVNPLNSVEIDADIALEFDDSLTLEGADDGSFNLMEDGEVVASLSVIEIGAVTRNTIDSCESAEVIWAGFKTYWMDGTFYAMSDDVDKMVIFEFLADEIETRIRLVPTLEGYSVKESRSADITTNEPQGGPILAKPEDTPEFSTGRAPITTIEYEFKPTIQPTAGIQVGD